MSEPISVPVQEQKEKIEINSNHVIKSLEFAAKKLTEYYRGAAEMNGMSYNRMLAIYSKIEEALNDFNDTHNRVLNNINTKAKRISVIPKRSRNIE